MGADASYGPGGRGLATVGARPGQGSLGAVEQEGRESGAVPGHYPVRGPHRPNPGTV